MSLKVYKIHNNNHTFTKFNLNISSIIIFLQIPISIFIPECSGSVKAVNLGTVGILREFGDVVAIECRRE